MSRKGTRIRVRQELRIRRVASWGVPTTKIRSVHRRRASSEPAADLLAHYLAAEFLDDEGRGVVVLPLTAVGLGE